MTSRAVVPRRTGLWRPRSNEDSCIRFAFLAMFVHYCLSTLAALYSPCRVRALHAPYA